VVRQAQVEIKISLVDKTTKGLNKLSSATKKLGQNMTNLGKSMTRNVTLPLVAIGGAAIKASVDLDKSMRNIQAFGGQTEEQLKDLSDQFREMSKDINITTDSAKGLADAYFNIQSAGFLAEDGIEVLTVSTKAATAGLTSTQKASEGIMAILNAYGLTAKEAAAVSDSLFTTIKFGVGTFEQLTPVLGKVIPIAASMGISFDEVNASLATISKAGVDFTTGATQIARVMTSMLSPSEALGKHMKALGFSSGQAMVDALGLNNALQMIADSVGNDTTKLNELFVETRAFQGVLNLTGQNARVFNQIMGEMGQKVGATDEAFQQQIKSVSAQMANMKNIVMDAFITLGDAILPVLVPILKQVADGIADVANWFKSLDEATRKNIVRFGLFVAAAGPILVIVGTVVSAIGSIVGAFSALAGGVAAVTGALPALGVAFTALTGPVGIAVAAFAGLVAFGPQILKFVTDVTSGIVNLGKRLLGYNTGKGLAGNLMQGMQDGVKEQSPKLFGVFKRVSANAIKTGEFTGKAIATGAAQGAQIANQQMQQVARNAAQVGRALGGQPRASQVGRIQIGQQRIGTNAKAQAAFFQKVHGAGGAFPSFASAPTPSFASAGGGGDVNITIQEMILPPGSTEEIANEVLDILAKKMRRRGITGISVG
jgi:TP901 family phage tail tape measure protein